jgi:5-methylcytosine-specific restriction enzyme B
MIYRRLISEQFTESDQLRIECKIGVAARRRCNLGYYGPSGPACLGHITLKPEIHSELVTTAAKLKREDKLLTEQQLGRFAKTFREKYGPEQLSRLDGSSLLESLHQANKDSLVYWLEFKNDEEFPTSRFGSIAGGSALKFTIFFRRETGTWMGRSLNNIPIEITPDEALKWARKHRDQLLAGVEILENFPKNGSDEEYERLQAAMDSEAPDVSNLSWGHKYFSLLFPDKLDDFHSADLQRFHLIKLLQVPPDKPGRYVLAGWYVELARQLDLQMNHLASVLNFRDGRQHTYWRIGTSEGDGTATYWPAMRDGNYVAIGWPELGDLSGLLGSQTLRDPLKQMLGQHYPNTPQATGRAASEINNFLKYLDDGDLVVAANGNTILGIGRVDPGSEYRFEPTDNFPHRRSVTWLNVDPWSLPQQEALRSTFRELKIVRNLVAIEERVIGGASRPTAHAPGPSSIRWAVPRLTDTSGRIQSVLERKGQVILYGPPGTGKTYWADRTAKDLVAYRELGQPFASVDEDKKNSLVREFIRTCTFHPAYGYEDFLEGFRPQKVGSQLVFDLQNGIFKEFCKDAGKKPESNYYLIVDEINRGDIPRIFGELLTVLERSKRGAEIRLAVSGAAFHVPPNVYVIGTMNTADRSIALLDKALRRRFGFVECMPDSAVLQNTTLLGIPLGPWLDSINRSVRQRVGRDARNLQIGHSYLMERGRPLAEFSRFVQVLQDDIVPLLEDYCYEDYDAMAEILGTGLVDVANQVVRHDLFTDSRRDDLIQALLAPYPEIVTSPQAVASEAPVEQEDTEQAESKGEKEP